MSVEQMRAFIAKEYDGQRWKDKVFRMSDGQVIAVYYSLLKKGDKNVKRK